MNTSPQLWKYYLIGAIAMFGCSRSGIVNELLGQETDDIRSTSGEDDDTSESDSDVIFDTHSIPDADVDGDSDGDSDGDGDADTDSDGDSLCKYECLPHCISWGGEMHNGNCSGNLRCCDIPVIPEDTDGIPTPDCVIHVSEAAGDNDNSGYGWDEALSSLPAALKRAQTNNCREVWVAKGKYYPTEGANQTVSILLFNGVALYGGFVGDERERDERRPKNNITILSGGVGEGKESEVLIKAASDVRIDGFRIETAYVGIHLVDEWVTVNQCDFSDMAMGIWSEGTGAMLTMVNSSFQDVELGIKAKQSTVDLRDMRFVDNRQGIALSDADIGIVNARFEDNTNQMSGGSAIFASESRVDISTSQFISNTFEANSTDDLSGGGGAISFYDSELVMRSCEFVENTTNGNGGAIWVSESEHIDIRDTHFSNGEADKGAGIYFTQSQGMLSNVSFEGHQSTSGTVFLNRAGVEFQDVRFKKNTVEKYGGAVAMMDSSVASINESLFVENRAADSGGAIYTGEKALLSVAGTSFKANKALPDGTESANTEGGAICLGAGSDAAIQRSIFSSNFSLDKGGVIVNRGHLRITDVLMEGNGAIKIGGAIHNFGGLDLSSATISGNYSEPGGVLTGGALSSGGNSGYIEAVNCIFHPNPYNTLQPAGDTEGFNVEYSSLAGEFAQEGNITGNPLFRTTPVSTTFTITEDSANVIDISPVYENPQTGDVIEVGDDGVARTVVEVTGSRVRFEPALNSVVQRGIRVDVWKEHDGALDVDYTLDTRSNCVDAGSGLFVWSDEDLQGNTRIISETVDMGAFELQ
ncbi:MAG: hypothetical protein JXR76_30980 [Deltaproteobacteria bacterium]|nr:hypothetical protein [Deltaproteobacteria bacterium]